MSKNLLVDTNILIDFSKGHSRLLGEYLMAKEWRLAVNPVIVAEYVNDRWLINPARKRKAEEFIDLFTHMDLNKKVGFKTGELIRSGQVDYLGDALIAASCLVGKTSLLTRNQKHFKKVKGLKLLPR